jgi:hypothetical protein
MEVKKSGQWVRRQRIELRMENEEWCQVNNSFSAKKTLFFSKGVVFFL